MNLIPASEARDMAYDSIVGIIDDIAKQIKDRAQQGYFDLIVEGEVVCTHYHYIVEQLKDSGYTVIPLTQKNTVKISWSENG